MTNFSGYAQQQDVHLPTSTVREALRFSAVLRQPRSVPLQEKYNHVEDVIKVSTACLVPFRDSNCNRC
jgi:ATP-binding cassette, subfamily G (WHITE), member 2, PDR